MDNDWKFDIGVDGEDYLANTIATSIIVEFWADLFEDPFYVLEKAEPVLRSL